MLTARRDTVPPLPTPEGIDGRRLHRTAKVEVIHLTIKPGGTLPRHSTPVDAFFYVLEGRGVLDAGGESQEIGEGTLVHCPAGSPHIWTNPADQPLRILVVKTPAPA